MKRTLSAALLLSYLLNTTACYAGPTLDSVEQGQVNVTQEGNHTVIDATGGTIANWLTMDTAADESWEMNITGGDLWMLNNILDLDGTQHLGHGVVNGRAVFFGEGGFYFGPDGTLVVNGGAIFTTLPISSQNFINRNFVFERPDGSQSDWARIVNEGKIQVAEGGFAVLIAPSVANFGDISAPLGTIALAAGDAVTVGLSDDGFVSVVVDKPVSGTVYDADGNKVEDQILNKGTLSAAGGRIVLKAEALADLYKNAINLDGVVEADHAVLRNGKIEIVSKGDVRFKGELRSDELKVEAGSVNIESTASLRAGFAEFRLSRDWRNLGAFEFGRHAVIFEDASQVSTVYGDNTFDDLTIVTPSKVMNFEAGKTQTVTGTFKVQGEKGKLVTLRSTDPDGVQWRLDASRGIADVSYVDLGDAWNIGDEVIKALPSNSFGNNTGWDTDPIWDGTGVTNNWSEAANWDTGVAPRSTDDVTFNALSIRDSFIDPAFAGAIRNLTIQSGYTGTLLFGRSLNVSQTVTQQGGTVNLAGHTLQTTRDYSLSAGAFNTGAGLLRVDRDFLQTGGTYNGNTGSLDVNRNTSLAGGTFNATTGTTSYAGNLTVGAGMIYNANGGTTVFDAASGTINVDSSLNLADVQLAASGTKTIAAGDRLIVSGDLALTSGKFSGGTLEAKGDVTVSSGYSTAGTSALEFTGTADQNFDLTGAEDRFDADIFVNKTGGEMRLLSDLTMNAGGQDLTVQNGTFDANGHKLSVAGLTTISGGVFEGGNTTIDLNGAFMQTGGVFNATSGVTSMAGNVTVSGGTFNAGSGTVLFDGGSSTLDFNTSQTFNAVTLDSTGTKTIAAGDRLVSTGHLALTDGRFNGGTLEARGDVTVGSTYTTGGTSALEFTGAADQTFDLTGAVTRFDADITVDKSGGTVALASNLTMNANNQDLTVREGRLDLNGNDVTVNGTASRFVVEDGAELRLEGGETVTARAGFPQLDAGSTVTYNGSGNYSSLLLGSNYHHLNFDGTGTWRHTAALDVNGDLTITSAATLNSNGQNVTLAGDWTNTGTYLSGANTVTLDGQNQTISGATTFNNFSKTVTTDTTLTFASGAANLTTVAGDLTLQGTPTATLNLRSGQAGDDWQLNVLGGTDFEHLNVQDSAHVGAAALDCLSDCVDAGNNTQWIFETPLVVPPVSPVLSTAVTPLPDQTEQVLASSARADNTSSVAAEDDVRVYQTARLRDGLRALMIRSRR